LKGNDKVLERFKQELGVEEGESTPDKLFHLQSVRCVGCCGLAPVCVVNGKTYGRVTPDDVPVILDEWRKTFEEN
jgi:NADH:ubiquinone oxidoreductase subunit E